MTFAPIDGDDYFLARVYGAVKLADNAELTLRIENAFDEDYDEVNGFPGLPLGAYADLSITF